MAKMRSERLLGMFRKLERANQNRYLFSIRTGFITTMPIMIIGAFALAINQMPIPAYQNFMQSVFGTGWRMFGTLAFQGTMQIISLILVCAICVNLTGWYNAKRNSQVNTGIAAMVGLACYVAVAIPVDDANGLPFNITGVTGLFVAIVVAAVSCEMFVRLTARKGENRLLSDDPSPAVPQAFASVLPAIAVVSAFLLLRVGLVALGVRASLDDLVYSVLSMPFRNAGNSVGTAVLFTFSSHLMWLFGIHGNNVLDQVAQDVYVPALQQNMEAVASGLPAPNLVTKTLFDVFVYMGGCGATLALILALLIFGKMGNYRLLFRYALPTSIFNINEPLVFGIPIVLNPIYAIPFVLTPVVCLATSALAMGLGLVPYTIAEVGWATPVFLSGYTATGSFAGVVLQAVNLALGVLIYAPFVRLSEHMTQLRFRQAYRQLQQVVTTEYAVGRRGLVSRMDELGSVARRLANQIPTALGKNEMYLVYQPIVDARTNTLHSVEALLRWRHPQHGLIHPMVTIALAEETGRIDELGLWIMEQAIRQRAAWNAENMNDFHVSVNVSARQLETPDFAERTLGLLEKYGVAPRQLQVELTEMTALVESDATHKTLEVLHKAGITLAMDDFGVGHSSLLYLRAQPITTLKIDASLSRDVVCNPINLDIISTIMELCRQMCIETVIEYVDNQPQLDLLKGIGMFLIQGYYYSPPLPPEKLADFLEDLAAGRVGPKGEEVFAGKAPQPS